MDAIMMALWSRGEAAAVQDAGCTALANLAFNADIRVKISRHGGIRPVLKALLNHGGAAAVQEQ